MTVWPGASVKHSVSVCTEANGDHLHVQDKCRLVYIYMHVIIQEFKNVYALVHTCVWHM